MNNLYFKDANGEFHPIKISQLDIKQNQLVFIQLIETEKKRVSIEEMEGLISVLNEIKELNILDNTEFVVLTNEIKIEVLNKDTELNNKEVLIDLSGLGNDKDKQLVQDVLRESLKKFQHEFVRLPIVIRGGSA